MDRTTHVRPGATVEFSETACMQSSDGGVYSAFVRNSYIARVVFNEDSRTVCVSLPRDSRMRGKTELVTDCIIAAQEMPDGGSVFL